MEGLLAFVFAFVLVFIVEDIAAARISPLLFTNRLKQAAGMLTWRALISKNGAGLVSHAKAMNLYKLTIRFDRKNDAAGAPRR